MINTDKIVEHLLDGHEAVPQILLGPVVWEIKQGSDLRQWYFMIASGGPEGCRVDQIVADDEAETECLRNALHFRLLQHRPIVIHDFDDELEMAKWAETIWPSPETRQIRSGIQAERSTR
jgi:hypothetical protein